jgi:hypothetical protein
MNDQLMLGILLIIVGVAVGLIAVALVLNRREARNAAELDEGQAPDEPDAGVEIKEEQEEIPDELEADEDTPEDEEPPQNDESREIPVPEEETPRERQLVAEVYREEVTGKLIVLTGDHEYTDSRQIKDETERRRLAYATSDLADWFQGEMEPRAMSAPATAPPRGSPGRMLEEINAILQRSISPERGVRLLPGADGGVKVLIGVKSYEIEEVPDDEIKVLIRQAVAEWEAGQ